MKRVMLTVAYDGTAYHGWQIQPGAVTIEGKLNEALTELVGHPVQVIGASRTDSGVHALGNVAVFDTSARMPAEKFSYALNQSLPEDIRIQKSEEVPLDFHPRKVPSVKTYEYRIYNAEFALPTKRLYAYHTYRQLDVERMNEAAQVLVGEHDFKSFCSIHTQAETTVRRILAIAVTGKEKDICIRVRGNGFLYNMVRIIAGTLIEVGIGRKSKEDLLRILASCDREVAGPTAPACGLTLVEYAFIDV